MSIVITFGVVTDDTEKAIKTVEALARLATGLVLDGIDVMIDMNQVEDEEESENDKIN